MEQEKKVLQDFQRKCIALGIQKAIELASLHQDELKATQLEAYERREFKKAEKLSDKGMAIDAFEALLHNAMPYADHEAKEILRLVRQGEREDDERRKMERIVERRPHYHHHYEDHDTAYWQD